MVVRYHDFWQIINQWNLTYRFGSPTGEQNGDDTTNKPHNQTESQSLASPAPTTAASGAPRAPFWAASSGLTTNWSAISYYRTAEWFRVRILRAFMATLGEQRFLLPTMEMLSKNQMNLKLTWIDLYKKINSSSFNKSVIWLTINVINLTSVKH